MVSGFWAGSMIYDGHLWPRPTLNCEHLELLLCSTTLAGLHLSSTFSLSLTLVLHSFHASQTPSNPSLLGLLPTGLTFLHNLFRSRGAFSGGKIIFYMLKIHLILTLLDAFQNVSCAAWSTHVYLMGCGIYVAMFQRFGNMEREVTKQDAILGGEMRGKTVAICSINMINR